MTMSRQAMARLIVAALVGVVVAVAVAFRMVAERQSRGRIHHLVQIGDVRGLCAELSGGADPNETITTGEPPKIPGVTPLMLAAQSGHVESVEVLLDSGANVAAVNELGESALYYGVDHPDAVQLLIDRGADVNRRTGAGQTPLVRAARIGRVRSVEELLRAGAELDGPFSPIAAAARGGHVETLRALLNRAIPDDAVWDSHLSEAVVAAGASGCIDCLELLLARGARVDARGSSGETSLMKACESAPAEAVEMLLRAGANPTLTDKMGQTALEYSRRRQDGQQGVIGELLALNR